MHAPQPLIRLTTAMMLLMPPVLSGATFHVAVTGDDSNAGSAARPLRTLAGARDAVRKLRADRSRTESVTIEVHRGTYRLESTLELGAEDSGSSAAPVVWRTASGEEVRLTGGPTLAGSQFQPVTATEQLERLDPIARGKVVQADLSGLGLGNLPDFPETFRGVPATPELFFNDQRMRLARWPNQGWATIARIVDTGSIPREGEKDDRPGVFEFAGDRPNRWSADHGVWLQGYWCFDWYEETIRVKAIDASKRQITLRKPSLYGVKQGNPSPRRYRALNVFEELDQPGEFYLDRTRAVLYFWPPGALDHSHIALSTLDAPLVALKDASHLAFQGFILEAGLGNGIEVSGGRSNTIVDCQLRNFRLLGVQIRGGQGHRVEHCDIHDTGTGGLVLEGGDRKTLTPSGHQANDNHIWDFSRHQLTAAYGLTLGGVGNRAANNLLHDAPHQAVAIQGNDHLFEYNIVRNVVTETDDAGALYKGRNPSCRGNVIRYNFWKDIGSPMGHGTAAIYFDDGDGGDLVLGNVFLRCGYPGKGSFGTVFSHGGHDIRAENNVFVECRRALGSAPWGDALWKETIDGGNDCHWIRLLREEVDIRRAPFTTRYPELVGFLDPKPGQPRVSRAMNTVLVRCGEATSGNWKIDAGQVWATETDPGFVSLEKGDLRLRPESEVFRRLPGFQPIPFEKIGLLDHRVQ